MTDSDGMSANKGTRSASASSSSSSAKSGDGQVRNDYVDGFMFVCNKDTYQECMDQALFGLPFHYLKEVKTLQAGLSALFLFNKSERRLHGIFEASTNGGANLKPEAWNTSGAKSSPFPAQIEFRVVKRGSISEAEFKHLFRDRQRIRKLTGEQVHSLIRLFPTGDSGRKQGKHKAASSKPISNKPAWGAAAADKGVNEENKVDAAENKAKTPAFAWASPPPKFAWGSAKPAVTVAENKAPAPAAVNAADQNNNVAGVPLQQQQPQDAEAMGEQQQQPQLHQDAASASAWGVQPAVSDDSLEDIVPPTGAAPMMNYAAAGSTESSTSSPPPYAGGADKDSKKDASSVWSYSDMLKRNEAAVEQDPNIPPQASAGAKQDAGLGQDNIEADMQNLNVGGVNSGGVDNSAAAGDLRLVDGVALDKNGNIIAYGNGGGAGLQQQQQQIGGLYANGLGDSNVRGVYNLPLDQQYSQQQPPAGQNAYDPFGGGMNMNGNVFNNAPAPGISYGDLGGQSFNQFSDVSSFPGGDQLFSQQNAVQGGLPLGGAGYNGYSSMANNQIPGRGGSDNLVGGLGGAHVASGGGRRLPPGLEAQQEGQQFGYDQYQQQQLNNNSFVQQQQQQPYQMGPPPTMQQQSQFDAAAAFGGSQFGLSGLGSGGLNFSAGDSSSWDTQRQLQQPQQAQQQQLHGGQFGAFYSAQQAPLAFNQQQQYGGVAVNGIGGSGMDNGAGRVGMHENKENSNASKTDTSWGAQANDNASNNGVVVDDDDQDDDVDEDLHAVCNGSQQCMCITCCPELPKNMTLAQLFIRVGMEEELQIFEQEEVDFQSLMMMSKSHLKDLGLTLGSRMKLIHVIRQLRRRI